MTTLKVRFEQALVRFGQKSQLPFIMVALLTVAVYGCFVVFYGDDPHHQSRFNREWFSWITCLSLGVLYVVGYFRLKSETGYPIRSLILWTLAIVGLNVLITPFHSTDLYGYINRGWQQIHYGLNPYIITVNDIPGWASDPMMTDHWVNNPCPYGFVFALIAKWLCGLGQGSLPLTLVLFKLTNGLLHLGMLVLLWVVLKSLNRPRPALDVYLLGWNPLMLLHQVANGHNDIWMGVFLLLAGAFMVWRLPVMILPALIAGTLIKYALVIILPVAAIFLYLEYGLGVLFQGVAFSALLLALTALPFLVPVQQVPWHLFTENATISHHSLHSVLFKLWKEITKWIPTLGWTRVMIQQGLKTLIGLGYLGFVGHQVWQWIDDHQGQKRQSFLFATMAVMMVILLAGFTMATSKFYPWYLGSVIPFAFLLGRGHRLRQLVITLSLTELFAFTLIGQAHVLNYVLLVAVPLVVFVADGVKRQEPSRLPA